MRTALHSVLRPGREEDYDREHARIWPEMAQSLIAAGITDWTIWRSGMNLFHLVESDDFRSAMAALAEDPVDRSWNDHINLIVDHFEPGEDDQALRTVWSLAEQVGSTASSDKPPNGPDA